MKCCDNCRTFGGATHDCPCHGNACREEPIEQAGLPAATIDPHVDRQQRAAYYGVKAAALPKPSMPKPSTPPPMETDPAVPYAGPMPEPGLIWDAIERWVQYATTWEAPTVHTEFHAVRSALATHRLHNQPKYDAATQVLIGNLRWVFQTTPPGKPSTDEKG